MKISVTDGAGFIGSRVADRYSPDGHDGVVLDSFSTDDRCNPRAAARLVEIDIRDRYAAERLFAAERFEVVNHHAAQVDVRKSTEDPFYGVEVNMLESLSLIRAAAYPGTRKIIYISTGGAIHGEQFWRHPSRPEPRSLCGLAGKAPRRSTARAVPGVDQKVQGR